MSDSLERFLQDLRFDVPVGLVERAEAAADVDRASARQAARRTHSKTERRAIRNGNELELPRHQWALVVVAAIVAIAIVATLLGVRALHLAAPTPANHGILPIRHHNGQIVVGGWTWAGDSPTGATCYPMVSDPSCHSSPISSLIAIDPVTGGQQTIISAPTGETISDATYSPDGSKLAYVIGPGGDFDLSYPSTFGSTNLAQSSIWVLNTLTGLANQITRCHCQQLGHLSWSPDSSRLVFADGAPVRGAQLYLIDVDGTHRLQLTHFKAPENATQPSWSPDGTRIAFSLFSAVLDTFGRFGPGSIDVIRPDGSGLGVILDEHSVRALGPWREPAWSPDGSKIAYVRLAVGPTLSGNVIGWEGSSYQLWVMNADGSHRTQIYGRGRPSGPQLDDWAWGGPAWSPDGTRIAIVAAPNYTLWVMNPDGSNPLSLSSAVGGDRPTWQPLP